MAVRPKYMSISSEDALLPVEQSENAHLPTQLPGPRQLKAWYQSFGRLLAVLADVFFAFVAVFFILFAMAVYRADGQPLDEKHRHLISIARYGPTVVPVLFGAVVGRSMRAFATWKIQRGTTIGIVEQLMGSITMARAFSTQLSLNAFNMLGFTIMIIWCLSPLGSQASLRIIYTERIMSTETMTATVMDPFSRYMSEDTANVSSTTLKALFTTSMVSYTSLESRNQDVWGNIRVPDLGDGTADWTILSSQSRPIYPSLVGLPLDKPRLSENTVYQFTTSYLDLSCPVFELSHPTIPGYSSWSNTTWNVGKGDQFTIAWDLSPESSPLEASMLSFESLVGDSSRGYSLTHAECYLTTAYVDLNASCSGKTCSLDAMRPSARPPRKFNATAFDNAAAEVFFQTFAGMFPSDDAPGDRNPIVQYLANPNDAFTDETEYVIYDIGRSTFELRLKQLLNTQLIIGISPSSVANGYFEAEPATFNTSIAIATTGFSVNFVRCSLRWFAVLLLASIVCLLVAVAGCIARITTLVPNVLGTLSLAMLENKCQEIAVGGSTLDTAEKTALLSKMHVRLGDVQPHAAVGRIALAGPLGETKVGVVQSDRYYF